MSNSTGKVYLIGAGPGDPELISLRGMRRLREADVVLHDALVHPELLAHCRTDAVIEYVGKRAGRAQQRQADINRRLIEAAKEGKTVARLKGGDPYLFGRGSEEAEQLAQAGVPFEVVPGVPSPLAASAYAGISLTHRSLSSSVAYVTATESAQKDQSSHDWSKLATATQTLVIFMGMRKLESLMQLLMEHGRSPETPAAVIQAASLPSQRTIVGTVGTIARMATDAGIGMPALTIVGDAVGLRQTMRWYDTKPLFGKRVWVTRMLHQASDFSRLLRDAGAEPVHLATIRLCPMPEGIPGAVIDQLGSFDWVIFTSSNGVGCFFDGLRAHARDARQFAAAKVCALGPVTAQALLSHGITPDLVPERYVAEAVVEALASAHAQNLSGMRILIPRAETARETLPEGLRALGAQVQVVPVYRTQMPEESEIIRLRERISEGQLDVVAFTASSTVRHAVNVLGDAAVSQLNRLTVACIGPVTAQTARELGVRVDVVAQQYTTAGLVDAMEAYFTHG